MSTTIQQHIDQGGCARHSPVLKLFKCFSRLLLHSALHRHSALQRCPCRMPKLVWNPGQTRDAQNSDGFGVMAQRRGILFCIQNRWRGIPAGFWAWRFVAREQMDGLEPLCTSPKQPGPNALGFWLPKLLLSANDPTLWDRIGREVLPSRPTPSLTNRRRLRATDFPPELFERICAYADGSSQRFRLVNRYWEQQCRRHVFAHITLQQSPQLVGSLLELTRDVDCRFMPFVRSIKGDSVPPYNAESKAPFLHLLGQTGLPVDGPVALKGPFFKGHRTIRSIHFAIPRSLPSCFSQGIRCIRLDREIHFQRHEDMIRLVSELPDLEVFRCDATFGSYPTELGRRRPWKSRNKLKRVSFWNAGYPAEENMELRAGYFLLALHPFLAVYNSTSFFQDGEIAVICALLRDVLGKTFYAGLLEGRYEYDPRSKDRMYVKGGPGTFFALRTRQDSTIVYYSCDGEQGNTDAVGWGQVAAACIGLPRAPQFVIGARSHRDLVHFRANVVEKMPSLFRSGTVRYSLAQGEHPTEVRWRHLTSLDSENLEGEAKESLMDVYP